MLLLDLTSSPCLFPAPLHVQDSKRGLADPDPLLRLRWRCRTLGADQDLASRRQILYG